VASSFLYGVLGTYTMILGTSNPAKVGYSKKVAGFLMASHMIMGLGFGATTGFLLNLYVIPHKENLQKLP